MMTPFFRFLRRVETGTAKFFDAEAASDFGDDWARFRAAGWLVAAPPSRHGLCPCCYQPAGPVHFLADPSGGPGRPMVMCRVCGLNAMSGDQLRRSVVHLPGLLKHIGLSLGVASEPTEIIPHTLWRLGFVRSVTLAREVFVVVDARPGQRPGIIEALRRRPRSLLFFLTPVSLVSWINVVDGKLPMALALSDFLMIVREEIHFDFPRLAEVLRRNGVSEGPARTPARQKRADRAANLETLTTILTTYVQHAHAHAWATQRETGVGDLAPRISQQALAKAAGLSPTAVSRCLKDVSDSARLLKLLWATLDDIDSLLAWRPTRGSR